MNKKYLYTAFAVGAMALNATYTEAKENASEKSVNTVFVCATQDDIPTMYSYTPGEVNLKPLISWHSEYLLPEQSGAEICQQTANKLQASIEQQEQKYIKANTTKEINSVCLVSEKDQTCMTAKSEQLFSVNSNYEAGCVLDNKKPIDCWALKDRGIYSFDDKPYQPVWWPW